MERSLARPSSARKEAAKEKNVEDEIKSDIAKRN